MRRWIPSAVFLILFVFCGFASTYTHGWVSDLVFANSLLCLFVCVLLVIGVFSEQKVVDSNSGKRVDISMNGGRNAFSGRRLFICLPGMGNSGDIVYAQHRGWLGQYGDVAVVNYPEKGFDGPAIIAGIVDKVVQLGNDREIVVVGQSMGVPLGIAVMSKLMTMPKYVRTRFYFVSVSGFVTAKATKMRHMLWTCDMVRDFAGSAWIWPKVLKLQFNPKSVDIESKADKKVVKRHYWFLRHGLYGTFAAQGRWIGTLKQLPATFAAGMVPCLLIETSGPDVLLDKPTARDELYSVFGQSGVGVSRRHSNGIHANLVECPENLRMLMQSWLAEQLIETPTTS